MKETKVLMVICDPVSEPTLREFLLLGGYRFSTAYVQEAEPPKVELPSDDYGPELGGDT
jgi:hypothetical protein